MIARAHRPRMTRTERIRCALGAAREEIRAAIGEYATNAERDRALVWLERVEELIEGVNDKLERE